MLRLFKLTPLFILITILAHGQDNVKNYYHIPEVLTFDSLQYKLIASYHPNDVYYKQEYVPAGEIADHFNKMIFIDFVVTELTVKDMVERKVDELNERKKSDPVVNYEVMENTAKSEYILDFILSSNQGNKLDIVERNIYRYKTYTDKAGHTGVLLFGVSQRGYGIGITAFFAKLKASRMGDINKASAYTIPGVEIDR